MKENETRQHCLELLETAEAAYLTTIDGDGFPQTRAMFNLRRKEQFPGLGKFFTGQADDFFTIFTTNSSSAKIAHVKANPNVSIYYCIPGEWRSVMLGGKIEISRKEELMKAIWQKGWETYYPGGVLDPDHTLLVLHPTTVKYYHQLTTDYINLDGNR